MAVNRMCYCACLTGSLAFYFASRTWFSWVVLLLVLGLPVLSLLLSLPGMLSARLSAELPRYVEQGGSAMLRLRLKALWAFPLPDARVRVNLRTRDRERDVRYLSRLSRADGILPLDCERCGFLAPEFEKAQVFDALGLFSLRLRRPGVEPMAILPPAVRPEPMPELDRLLNRTLKPKPGGGFSEAYDYRPYRPGDPVKGIHWKLSVKTDRLVVREPLEPVRQTLVLAARTSRSSAEQERILGALRYLSEQLLASQTRHIAVWMDGQELNRAEIASREDLLEALARACCASPKSYALPQLLPFRADWICRIGEEVSGC